ncbi:hypothetical protein [Roseobacter weihaiensis]|uniref:hypothetical protein n=1 Tax=Roseobacter weihaiensis TaxID=2763262 RepID=UPI001D0B2700|nr:hypothetical protein [Roseobacter sp. H9]
MIMIKYEDKIFGWSGIAGDAIAASYRIPKELTAREAALKFCALFVEGFSGDERPSVPNWLAELDDP